MSVHTDVLAALGLVDEGGDVGHDVPGARQVRPVGVLRLRALEQLVQQQRVPQDPLHRLDQDRAHVEARHLGMI